LGIQSGPGKLPPSPATKTRSAPSTRQYSSALKKPPGERAKAAVGSPGRPGQAGHEQDQVGIDVAAVGVHAFV
jgi:hypothetical protein